MINDYLRERITCNMFSHFRVMFAKLRFLTFKKDITRSCHLAISEEPFQETRSAFRRALQWTKTSASDGRYSQRLEATNG